MIKTETKVAGRFKFEAVQRDGTRRLLLDWVDNLITDNGLNLIGSSENWLSFCQVGTGSAAPSFGDTSLANKIAHSNTIQSSISGIQSAAPYFTWRRNTYRFAEGSVVGNIAEVGIGPISTGDLLSRALVVDSGGVPTTISIQSDETLDVTYEFRYYPPTVDGEFTIEIAGDSYDVVSRASNITSGTSVSGWLVGQNGTSATLGGVASSVRAFDGEMGAITTSPAGSASSVSAGSNSPYSTGSHKRAGTATWLLNSGNFPTGISSMFFKHGIGSYQLGFTPAIPKDNTKVLEITVEHSWGRKTS